MLEGLVGVPSGKYLKTDPLRGHLRVIVIHAILATWPIECYSYSYCVGGSYACWSYAAVSALPLDYDFHKDVAIAKSLTQLLSISLPSSFRGHPGLAKYSKVWVSANHQ